MTTASIRKLAVDVISVRVNPAQDDTMDKLRTVPGIISVQRFNLDSAENDTVGIFICHFKYDYEIVRDNMIRIMETPNEQHSRLPPN